MLLNNQWIRRNQEKPKNIWEINDNKNIGYSKNSSKRNFSIIITIRTQEKSQNNQPNHTSKATEKDYKKKNKETQSQ